MPTEQPERRAHPVLRARARASEGQTATPPEPSLPPGKQVPACRSGEGSQCVPRRRSALSPTHAGADGSYQLCVCARKSQRRCLPAPSLFCSLPPFANIGFKPAQNSAQRKAAAAAAAAAAGASPADETPQPQDAPPCLVGRLLGDSRPALHPRYPGGVFGSWGSSESLEQDRREGGEPGEGGVRDAREGRGGLAVCTHTRRLAAGVWGLPSFPRCIG